MATRPGTTLVELTVALTLLCVGLLVLLASLASHERQARVARLDAGRSALALTLLERAAACMLSPAGDTTVGGVRAVWTTRPDSGIVHVRLALDPVADGATAAELRSAAICAGS